MNKAVVPQIPQEETTRSHTNSAWIRLVHLCPHVSCLVRSRETLAAKHPHRKETSILTTSASEQCAAGAVFFAKQEIVYFLFKEVYPKGTHVPAAWESKAEGDCGSLCHVVSSEHSWAV